MEKEERELFELLRAKNFCRMAATGVSSGLLTDERKGGGGACVCVCVCVCIQILDSLKSVNVM